MMLNGILLSSVCVRVQVPAAEVQDFVRKYSELMRLHTNIREGPARRHGSARE